MSQRQKIAISVLVQTKNESIGIAKCLNALTDFSEIIVVDSNSTDDTVAIAKSLGARVETFTWNGTYPKKKQWQLDNLEIANEWLLFLDADETPTQFLIDELRSLQENKLLNEANSYRVRLDYFFAGKRLKFGHRVVKTSLLRKGFASYPIVDDLDIQGMGELEGHYQPAIKGPVKTLRGRIAHHDLDPVRTWFDRHNRYSDWESELRARTNVKNLVAKHRSLQGRIFDKVPGKPVFFFMYSYFIRFGFLDGRAGFDYAIALAMYYWQIDLKVREKAVAQ